jgi:hypothetical protein
MPTTLPLYTKKTPKGTSLFSSKAYKKGDTICTFGAALTLETPNQKTIQIGDKKHIHLDPDILQYTNHHCDPNVFYNSKTMQVETIKDIEIDDEITFFYPSTEWDMSDPFECKCGSEKCIHIIKGAKDLDKTILSQYRVSEFIKSLLF